MISAMVGDTRHLLESEHPAMDFETLVRERRSIRGYKPDPVPKEVIHEIIEIAKGAPSSMNTQPWFFHVVTGEPLERIRRGNTERMLAGAKPQREIPVRDGYEGIYRQRQIEVAIQLFQAMGIARDDKEKRQDWVMRGFRQFDAPVSIVVTYDKSLEPATISHFDLGAVTYGLVLAARPPGCAHDLSPTWVWFVRYNSGPQQRGFEKPLRNEANISLLRSKLENKFMKYYIYDVFSS